MRRFILNLKDKIDNWLWDHLGKILATVMVINCLWVVFLIVRAIVLTSIYGL